LGAVRGCLNNQHTLFVDSIGLPLSQTPFGTDFQPQQTHFHTKFHCGRGFVDMLPSWSGAMHEAELASIRGQQIGGGWAHDESQ
jgi:hypothetical protein